MNKKCAKCEFLVFRQCWKYPAGDYVCFSAFSPSSSCKAFCYSNLRVMHLSLDDIHKPVQLYFWDFV